MATEKKLRTSFAQREAGNEQTAPIPFTVERVSSEDVLRNEWEPVFAQIFTDENDREPIDQLVERLKNGEDFFVMRTKEGKVIGIELAQVRNGNGAMYIPWTGVLEEYRNLGIGAKMNRTIADYMRKRYGVTHTLIDIEDPRRLHNSGYQPDEVNAAIGFAIRRINFWRRQGFIVVDDNTRETGSGKLEYVRPASDDEQKIQGYDHMSIRLDDPDLKKRVLNSDGTAVRRQFVRQCYLDMTRIQYGNKNETELRAAYPAVDKYLSDIDAIESGWLPVRTDPIHQKTSPTQPVDIRMAAGMEMEEEGPRSKAKAAPAGPA